MFARVFDVAFIDLCSETDALRKVEKVSAKGSVKRAGGIAGVKKSFRSEDGGCLAAVLWQIYPYSLCTDVEFVRTCG